MRRTWELVIATALDHGRVVREAEVDVRVVATLVIVVHVQRHLGVSAAWDVTDLLGLTPSRSDVVQSLPSNSRAWAVTFT
jgi:hypothetical protein